jgi:hypothetical protein
MNTLSLHRLSLAALSLGGLLLYGCAATQPIAGGSGLYVRQSRRNSAPAASIFVAKRQALVAAEPAPEIKAAPEPASAVQPQAAAEPAPEPKPKIADEPEPKRRGPLTSSEETEIDAQVMP